MRFSIFTCLSFFGVVRARVPHLKLAHKDKGMSPRAVDWHFHGCSTGVRALSAADFKWHVRKRHLHGPCRFTMNRTYKGDLKGYQAQTKGNMTQFAFNIHAAKGLSTYIVTIEFIQKGVGFGCSDIKFSRLNKDDNEKPRYFTSILQLGDENNPRWGQVRVNQIEGGEYLFEVPTTCLSDPTRLVIKTEYVYEDVGTQLQFIENSGEFIPLSDECKMRSASLPIESRDQYRSLLKSLSRDCHYRFEREYRWIVPEHNIYSDAVEKVVVAQMALDEPMYGDQTREVVAASLGHLSGPGCSQVKVFEGPKVVALTGGTYPINTTVLENGFLRASLKYGDYETAYNFEFHLPERCELTNPVVKFRYVDTNKPRPTPWARFLEGGYSYFRQVCC